MARVMRSMVMIAMIYMVMSVMIHMVMKGDESNDLSSRHATEWSYEVLVNLAYA